MRYLALVLTFSLLCSSCETVLIAPTAYPATVKVVMVMQGASGDVSIGKYDKSPPRHGAYATSAKSRIVLGAAPVVTTFVTKPGLDDCHDMANTYVKSQMGTAWSVEKSPVITGHCWQAGGWRSCDPNVEPFVPHAFRIQDDGAVFSEFFAPQDQNRVARNVTVTFWVVVQPYH